MGRKKAETNDSDFNFDVDERLSLDNYKKNKTNLLHQLGFYNVTEERFANATSKIQVDNIAHSIILSEEQQPMSMHKYVYG